MTPNDDEIVLDMSGIEQYNPKRKKGDISNKLQQQRYKKYKVWMSDDVADFASYHIPLKGKGTRAIRIMRKRVLDFEKKNYDPNQSKEFNRQLAIDIVTTEMRSRVQSNIETEKDLLSFGS